MNTYQIEMLKHHENKFTERIMFDVEAENQEQAEIIAEHLHPDFEMLNCLPPEDSDEWPNEAVFGNDAANLREYIAELETKNARLQEQVKRAIRIIMKQRLKILDERERVAWIDARKVAPTNQGDVLHWQNGVISIYHAGKYAHQFDLNYYWRPLPEPPEVE